MCTVKWLLLQQSNQLVGAVRRRQWKLNGVLSRGKNWWTGVLCFVLHNVSLYNLGLFVAPYNAVPDFFNYL